MVNLRKGSHPPVYRRARTLSPNPGPASEATGQVFAAGRRVSDKQKPPSPVGRRSRRADLSPARRGRGGCLGAPAPAPERGKLGALVHAPEGASRPHLAPTVWG